MSTRKARLDTLLQSNGVAVEPEELVEPEIDSLDDPNVESKPTRVAWLRERLGRYGNRVIGSMRNFFITFGHMLANVGTALAGSIILLPFVILVRGVEVLLSNFFSLF